MHWQRWYARKRCPYHPGVAGASGGPRAGGQCKAGGADRTLACTHGPNAGATDWASPFACGGGASPGKHKGQSMEWCSVAASSCAACPIGLSTHCGAPCPEHSSSKPCAAIWARAIGAHTPAPITHSHNTTAPQMARRVSKLAAGQNMRCILGKGHDTLLAAETSLD